MADLPPHHMFNLRSHIQRGDAAPWWKQGAHKFAFDPEAGLYIAMIFYGTAGDQIGEAALCAAEEGARGLQGKARVFAVGADPLDWRVRYVSGRFPSLRFLADWDNEMNHAYGVGQGRVWIVL